MTDAIRLVGIDTNVLARYILQDDEKQAKTASDFLESLHPGYQGYITKTVLVELVWLFAQGYKLPRNTIANVITEILTTNTLQIESANQVSQALAQYQQTTADFSDLLIATTAKNKGCEQTVIFDKKASKHANMTLLD